MKVLEVTTFEDLAKVGPSKVRSLVDGKVCRTFKILDEEHIHLTAGDGTELLIERSTPMWYEAWDFDRGSICFKHPDHECDLKAFTEMDWLETRDGEKYRLIPSEELLKNARRFRHETEAI